MRTWDINEVMTANEWLDIKDDQEFLANEKARLEAKARGRK